MSKDIGRLKIKTILSARRSQIVYTANCWIMDKQREALRQLRLAEIHILNAFDVVDYIHEDDRRSWRITFVMF